MSLSTHRLAVIAGLTAIGCGGLITWDPYGTGAAGGPADDPPTACEQGAARWCEVPDCAAVQHCRPDGSWSPCFCVADPAPYEECDPNTPVRRCANDCGARLSRCVDGIWQPCNAFIENGCHNGCAPGTEYCVEGRWLPCDAPTVQPCSNGCAEGRQQCVEGSWTDCDAPFERDCSNDCGTGQQRCINGSWSTCDATDKALAISHRPGEVSECMKRYSMRAISAMLLRGVVVAGLKVRGLCASCRGSLLLLLTADAR